MGNLAKVHANVFEALGNLAEVLANVLGVPRNLAKVLANVLGVPRNLAKVLANVLGVPRNLAEVLADKTLDAAVRSAFDACKKYERNNDFVLVTEKAFPGNVITPIVRAPREKEPDLVQQVIACLRELAPENGELSAIASKLEAALHTALTTLDTLAQKTHESDNAAALETLGKKEYVEKYSAIYHNACAELGRNKANTLFPIIWNGKKTTIPEQEGGLQPALLAA
jgi:hypothetical protein